MTGLVEWLRAQLDADAGDASIISSGGYDPQTWHVEGDPRTPGALLILAEDHCIGDPPGCVERAEAPLAVVMNNRAEYAHIARWDPARVIAEIDAKRRLLDEHQIDRNSECETCRERGLERNQVWPCLTVRLLAVVYADRPGYREEWRP